MNNNKNYTKQVNIMIAGNLLCPQKLIDAKEGKEANYNLSFLKVRRILSDSNLSIVGANNDGNAPIEYYRSAQNNGIDLIAYSKKDYKKVYNTLLANECNIMKNDKALSYKSNCMPFTNDIYYTTELNGIGVGIICLDFINGFDNKDLGVLKSVVNKMRDDGIEFIIAYLHWAEYGSLEINPEQRAIALAIAEVGIDYIIGNNKKCLQKYEVIKCSWGRKVPILYSIGNFVNASNYLNYVTSVVISLNIYKDKNDNIFIEDFYLPCFVFTILGREKYVVDFLNKKYNIPKTDELVEKRKSFISYILGEDIRKSNDYGFNTVNQELSGSEKMIYEANTLNDFETDIVLPPSNMQSSLIKEYMLTDEYRDKYGKALMAKGCNEQFDEAIKAIKEEKGEKNFIFEKYEKLVVDLLYSKNVLGFKFYEFFGYGFEKKSILKRTEFVPEDYRLYYCRRLNTNKKEVDHLDNKYTSYQRLKKFYGRDAIFISNEGHKETFKRFCKKHNMFILKPVNSSLGAGIKRINVEDFDNYEQLFYQLLKVKHAYICEEAIIQKDYIAEFNSDSVNTVRIFTYNNGSKVVPICSWIKTGRKGSVVDNATAGGLLAAINVDIGEVIADACDYKGKIFKEHPDTCKAFKKMKIQDWDEAIQLVSEAAFMYPEVRLIGWDIAHSINGWQIVEGNSQGQFNVYQLSTKKGMRKTVEKRLGWQSNILV